MKADSPARFGTPETTDDAGIYGGTYPWKDGLLPANPHIDFIYFPATVVGNQLHVRLRVGAQNE
ncbi:MAG: hypothetical protein NZ534_13210 [Bacteroidia bacterium]|nr:hypothetical protein [Bacteroidia bacterium]